MDIFWSL